MKTTASTPEARAPATFRPLAVSATRIVHSETLTMARPAICKESRSGLMPSGSHPAAARRIGRPT